MPDLSRILKKYSRENFLIFLIEKQRSLMHFNEGDLKMDEKSFIVASRGRRAQQDLLDEVLSNLPLEDREEIARLKARSNLW